LHPTTTSHTFFFFENNKPNSNSYIAYCIGKSFKGGILCLGWKEGRKERIHPPSIKVKNIHVKKKKKKK
jgi:hypothetical protein